MTEKQKQDLLLRALFVAKTFSAQYAKEFLDDSYKRYFENVLKEVRA